jgi:hypothetical protein
MTPRLQPGLSAYRTGHYFEAHERWEEVWRDERDPVTRDFVQGLIQLAAAMHKLVHQHNAVGALRLLDRARAHLAAAPPDAGGLDVTRLVTDIARASAALEALHALGRVDLDPLLVPMV